MEANMNIFGVSGGRIILAQDEDLGVFITWNRSTHLQMWAEASPGMYEEKGEVRLAYLYTLSEAESAATDWLGEYKKELGA